MTASCCNATLTTATVSPCPDPGRSHIDCDENGYECISVGHITLRTHTCTSTLPCPPLLSHCAAVDVADHTGERQVMWWDHTHGATPHNDENEVTE